MARTTKLTAIAVAIMLLVSAAAQGGNLNDRQLPVRANIDRPTMMHDAEAYGPVEEPLFRGGDQAWQATLQYASSDLWGGFEDIDVQGDYVYCATVNGLMIFDVSDINDPQLIARYYDDQARRYVKAKCVGDRLYVYAWNYIGYTDHKLVTFDVSDPYNPVLTNRLDLPAGIYFMEVVGNLIYAGCTDDNLRAIYIANPDSPVVLRTESLDINGVRAAVSGDYLLVPGANDGLQVVDISNPVDPIYVGAFKPFDEFRVSAVVEAGGYYLASFADDDPVDVCGVAVLEHEGSLSFSQIGLYSGTSEYARDLDYEAGYAFFATGYRTVEVLDLADPENPAKVSSLGPEIVRMRCVGDRCYGIGEDGLQVFDISDPAQPGKRSRYDKRLNDADIYGNYAYVADLDNGVEVLDISDPEDIHSIGRFMTSEQSERVPEMILVEDGFAYVMTDYDTLCIYDVADPINPVGLSSLPVWKPNQNMEYHDGLIGVANDSGVVLIDVSDPYFPEKISQYTKGGWTEAACLAFEGNTLYAGFMDGEIHAVDIADPSEPQMLGYYTDYPNVRTLEVENSMVYSYTSTSVLLIIDMSDPQFPVKIVNDEQYHFNDIQIVQDKLFLGYKSGGLYVLDIYNPAQPQELISYFAGSSRTQFIEEDNGYIFACFQDGFYSFSYEIPQHICGDADGTGGVDIDDIVYTINFVFAGGPSPTPLAAGDVNCSGTIDIDDVVYLVAYVFGSGPVPCADCP